ncbi:MAG TPA: hypothetical protein VF422_01300 [Dokdonella sp.]
MQFSTLARIPDPSGNTGSLLARGLGFHYNAAVCRGVVPDGTAVVFAPHEFRSEVYQK